MKRLEIPIVKGPRILVEIEELKDLKVERIVLSETHQDRRRSGCETGRVVSIGPDAFLKERATEPYCVPGEYILFIQYAGIEYKHPETKKMYRIINPADVACIIGERE